MRVAIVGCGYVADMYLQTLPGHHGVQLAGVWDRDPQRLAAFTAYHRVRAYRDLEDLLADDSVQMVVNLTNPRSHYEVSRAALERGRHVYSEKPLAMTLPEARELADVARERGLGLAAAPCNHLSDVVAAAGEAVGAGRVGRVLVVHAEMDDGMVPGLRPETWRSISGAPWPVRDEYEVGCTLEHAGYQLAPLVELFGPVRRVTAFNACLLPDKVREHGGTVVSPDLSVGLLEFDDGVVARLTNSILAPADRSLRIVGERGVLTLSDVWEYHTPLRLARTGAAPGSRVTRRVEHAASRVAPGLVLGRRLRVRETARVPRTQGGHRMDFARGIAQLAAQLESDAPVRMDAALALHVTEVSLALQSPEAATGVETTTDVPRRGA